MILTDTHQYALLDFYFPNGFTAKQSSTYLDGIIKGIELHQEHLKTK